MGGVIDAFAVKMGRGDIMPIMLQKTPVSAVQPPPDDFQYIEICMENCAKTLQIGEIAVKQ